MKENTTFVWGKEQVKAMDLPKLSLTTPSALLSFDYTVGAGDIILVVDTSLHRWR